MLLAGGAALLLVHSALATNSTCGVGYEPVGTKCLQLTGSGYTFDECATTECPNRGGLIAAIASQEEFDAVYDAVTGGGLQGGWPGGCAFVGLHRCNAQETWRWTTGDAGTDAPWGDGEPNDWAGSEDCGMVCDHIDGGLNDGPCHNTIHCICEEGLEELVRYDEGQCPEPDWAGWYTLAFLLGFFFWLCAIYGCAGLPQMCSKYKAFANGACFAIVLFCILLTSLWTHIVAACYGMNAGIYVSAHIGAAVGFLAALALSGYTRHRMALEDDEYAPNTPALEMVPVVPTQQQIVQIQVPPNSYPGMPVQVRVPDGRIVSVPIPEGTGAGQIINVAVPAPAPTSVSSEAIPVAEAYQAERVSGPPLSEEQCVICQEAIRGAHERLPCSHVFHRACLERWLRDREHRFCPICKKTRVKVNNKHDMTQRSADPSKSTRSNHSPHAGAANAREDISGRGVAGSRSASSTALSASSPRPTRTSAPTMRRTWCLMKPSPSNATRTSGPWRRPTNGRSTCSSSSTTAARMVRTVVPLALPPAENTL